MYVNSTGEMGSKLIDVERKFHQVFGLGGHPVW